MEELYKLILVDDEDEVRGRISSKISNDSGFTVVGAAGNGYDALELIEKLSPHVVLTDIKMPFIDGIELASLIRRDYPTVRVAFITGYDEFDYAREAIELNVSSYLTKPVTQGDISRFLDKLKAELDKEIKEKYNLELLKSRFEQSIPLIIDNYFISYLVSTTAGNAGDIENLKAYGVSLDEGHYLLSYIKMERDEAIQDVMEYEKRKLSLRSVIQSIMERHSYDYYSFLFNDGIIFIIKEKGKLFLREVDQVFYEMQKKAERFLSARIDIGISSLHREFRQLHQAYEEAGKALAYSKFLNAGRIIYIDQLEDHQPKILNLSDSEIRNLEHTVKFGSDNEIRNLMETLKLNALRDNKTIANYRPYIINMLHIMVNYSDSIGLDLNTLIGGDVLDEMVKFRSLDQMFDWALSIFLKLRELNLTTKMTSSQKLLDRAVRYIDDHYEDPVISMERVCDELGISVSYLSLLFKKERETTFVKYLTSVRMEKAKEYLKLTGDKIIDIAGKCGYNEVYYFSHSFKKYTGLSPKKYREEVS